ncbi:MAG: Spx/MgsR family RNA polymerase-binding regulatory protein [Dokdonella sp.]|jgi:Spx/MgsR family transcriptional regulator|uniref:Spx/MgsR family RNA polymerase-binding regulatory protein n=1 Tax=Dokdonella sp. TaxID=2291710 RepID=UPI001B488B8F|nr:Spx/MgsR family RNA polymerase-binding regulatory protein [Dokdonella sp.]MBK8124536.1 Spx/MgsR family RNA polymerase-binding regulatory protein [Dokdonella sp.]MBP6327218.1 Spx/MgsR family RNA polymerase-binding regulatory protein [Dokdonella sp.]MBP6328724.1 Spx/MgsR family RNA polymerase-binding regulatory protein [Dokdonella sp.]HNV09348.1 Spx/MgsR family RNA polymerase-binding regulatory protein [Dokdonella sp.]HQV49485.1 Spx/MgsR family RNA polymerase-binding regulatory protein [Dokdo
MAIQMYGLKNCDTCKKARNWLDRHAVEYRFIDYREQPATPEQLKRWAEAAGGFEKLVNRAGTTWRNLPPARKTPGSTPEWTLLIREYPALVRRPVLVMADASVLVGFAAKSWESRIGSRE